jgi:hypothetical protein
VKEDDAAVIVKVKRSSSSSCSFEKMRDERYKFVGRVDFSKKKRKKYDLTLQSTRTGQPTLDCKNKPIKSLECTSQPDSTSHQEFRYEVDL